MGISSPEPKAQVGYKYGNGLLSAHTFKVGYSKVSRPILIKFRVKA